MTRYIDNKDVGQSPPFDPENIVIVSQDTYHPKPFGS